MTCELQSNTNRAMKNELQCNTKQSNIISVRFSSAELSEIKKYAVFNGLSRGALIRMAVTQLLNNAATEAKGATK